MVESDAHALPPRAYEQLQLCTKCFQLTGPVLACVARPAEYERVSEPNGRTRLRQIYGSGDLPEYHKHCDCERESGRELQLDFRALWPGRGDSGASCELCFACALELRDVSSKFSLVVCRICLPVLQHANEFAGRLMFPVGWHSIVNSSAGGRIPPAPQSPKQVLEQPDALIAYARLQTAGLESLQLWRRTAVELNLRAAGLLDGVPPARVPLNAVFIACERARYQRDLRAVQLVRSTRPWTEPPEPPRPAPETVPDVAREPVPRQTRRSMLAAWFRARRGSARDDSQTRRDESGL